MLAFCTFVRKKIMRTTFTIFAILFIHCFILHGQIIHVPQDQATIQAAIDYSTDHDTILVAPGEYFENINFNGKNIVLCSDFVFTRNFSDIQSTIINGSLPVHADTASCVLIVSGEDSTAVLQGFTITGGKGTRWEDEHGANHWYTEGGGILIQYSSPTIKDNIITWNEAINIPSGTTSAGGGGIRCGDGNPHIFNNIISYNKGRYGGGIVMNYSGALIKNNIIIGNSGGEDFGGGGLWFLYNGDKPLILENNTIVNNSSALGGGGIRVWYCQADLVNNIFWGNTASYSTSQIQGNTANVSYCCVEGGFDGEGNIEDNPDFTGDTYILADGSPCIDAGNPALSYYDPEDPVNPGHALYPAKGTLHADMGVYGGPGSMQLPDIITSINSHQMNGQGIEVNIFPNPAVSVVNIELITNQDEAFEIQISDSNKVVRRISKTQSSTLRRNKFEVNVSDLKPGYYFIIVRSGNGVTAHKFVKI